MKRAVLLALIPVLMSCEKEEKKYAPGLDGVFTAGIGDDYTNQLYFNLQTASFISENTRDASTLLLDAGTNGAGLRLNSANFMFAKDALTSDFESVTDTIGIGSKRYDFPTGNPARFALAGAIDALGQPTQQVFVLVMGFDASFHELGLKKIQVKEVTSQGYTIRCARLNNTEDTTLFVPKDVTRNHRHLNLLSGENLTLEPPSANWHLHFTQYTDYDITEAGDTIPYLVRGVLLNPGEVEVAKLGNADFNALSRADAQAATYTREENIIGYDWKIFTLATGQYEVVPNAFFLRDSQGNYYKLRFVEYYNDLGEKGYAKFELVEL